MLDNFSVLIFSPHGCREDKVMLTLCFVTAVLGFAQRSVIRGLLQREGADDCLAQELGTTDLLLLVLFLGGRLQQLPLLPQFHCREKEQLKREKLYRYLSFLFLPKNSLNALYTTKLY